jgi:hypothetical protein
MRIFKICNQKITFSKALHFPRDAFAETYLQDAHESLCISRPLKLNHAAAELQSHINYFFRSNFHNLFDYILCILSLVDPWYDVRAERWNYRWKTTFISPTKNSQLVISLCSAFSFVTSFNVFFRNIHQHLLLFFFCFFSKQTEQ